MFSTRRALFAGPNASAKNFTVQSLKRCNPRPRVRVRHLAAEPRANAQAGDSPGKVARQSPRTKIVKNCLGNNNGFSGISRSRMRLSILYRYSTMQPPQATIEIPSWLTRVMQSPAALPAGDTARMEWAIDLVRCNIAEKTGGPFAAAIFEESSGECVAAGVNLVTSSGTSVAHAETVAIMLAQRRAGSYDLARHPQRRYTLYATGQPCIMCFGAIWWSGITRLVCGARGEDVESITRFQEGPLPPNWPDLLSQRPHVPIEVVRDVARDAACDVLRAYMAAGHPVYNPGSTA